MPISAFSNSFMKVLGRNRPTIIVASMGRSGSTLVYSALASAAQSRPAKAFLRNLSGASVEPGLVYKTHDFPEALHELWPVRAVFVYGRASDAARSVYFQEKKLGREWIRRHFENLHSDMPFEDLFDKDVLRIGDQLDAWTSVEQVPVLGIRYDAIWDNARQLTEFTGLPLGLPEKLSRTQKILPTALEEKCTETYQQLDRRIEKMPDVFLSGPKVS